MQTRIRQERPQYLDLKEFILAECKRRKRIISQNRLTTHVTELKRLIASEELDAPNKNPRAILLLGIPRKDIQIFSEVWQETLEIITREPSKRKPYKDCSVPYQKSRGCALSSVLKEAGITLKSGFYGNLSFIRAVLTNNGFNIDFVPHQEDHLGYFRLSKKEADTLSQWLKDPKNEEKVGQIQSFALNTPPLKVVKDLLISNKENPLFPKKFTISLPVLVRIVTDSARPASAWMLSLEKYLANNEIAIVVFDSQQPDKKQKRINPNQALKAIELIENFSMSTPLNSQEATPLSPAPRPQVQE
jgi:hypothetical protein